MPYNGSGTFNRVYSWVQDALNGLFISSTRMDTEMDGMATGLTNALTRDGQSPPSANIPMAGFKITGLGTGVAATDAANVGQLPTDLGVGPAFAIGNSGAAFNFSADNGRSQTVTLNANTVCTLVAPTVTTKTGYYYLAVTQNGGFTLGFAGIFYLATRWINDLTAPTPNYTAGSGTWYEFYWSGSVWAHQKKIGTPTRQSNYNVSVARQTSNQVTVAGVTTKVQFNNFLNDPYSEFDTVTNFRWVPKVAGLYLVSFTLRTTNASADFVTAQISLSGTVIYEITQKVAAATAETKLVGVYPLIMQSGTVLAGGFIEINFLSTTGAGAIIFGAGQPGTGSSLQITRIGDAE